MVLNAGMLVELDTPTKLLENPDDQFYSLWQKHLKSHGSGIASFCATSLPSDSIVQDLALQFNAESKRRDIAL